MTRIKKAASFFLCLVLALGLFPAMPAFADADQLQPSEVSDLGTIQETQDSSVITPTQDSQEHGVYVQNEFNITLDDIGYVLIERSEVPYGEEQNIVVSFRDDSLLLDSASLTVSNLSGTEEYSFSSYATISGAVAFKLEGGRLGNGYYQLKRLDLSVCDRTFAVEFDSDSENAYMFAIVNDGADDSPLSSFAIDADGELVEAEDVQSALDQSSQAALSGGISSFSVGQSAKVGSGELVVALDPGHGGYDGGAGGYGLSEKDVNLSIAQYAKAELEEYYGVRVALTRTGDYNVGLSERVEYAVSQGADVFVSIHCNASNGGARGAEVIVPNESSWRYNETHVVGTQLGEKILQQLSALGLDKRSVYWKDCTNNERYDDGSLSDYFTVIDVSRRYGIPGIIIEHAYIDNAGDAGFLASEDNRRALGVADATAIAQQYGLTKNAEERYWPVYSYEYYIEHNPKVYAAYGDDRAAAFNHFIQWGMSEGLQANDLFNLDEYKRCNPDLVKVYGGNNVAYYDHFIQWGMSEGRQASEAFSVEPYYNRYPDLRRAFGHDIASYYRHYIEWGKGEGRDAVTPTSLVGYETSYNGVDYADVYDGAYYAEHHPDVREYATFRLDKAGVSLLDDGMLVQHFADWGMSEGRQASEAFSVEPYYNRYKKLRVAYGHDIASYYMHYILWGKDEGLDPVTPTSLVGYETSYNGVDYADVYDGAYYAEHHPDVREYATFRLDKAGVSLLDDGMLVQHFADWGMSEGRQASEAFSVEPYYNRYKKLRVAYGHDIASYYMHYILWGKDEGLDPVTPTSLVGYETSYNGVDYADVYDGAYYAEHHPDVREYATFRLDKAGVSLLDDGMLVQHFADWGMSEGRQASEAFSVEPYYNRYPDLRRAFGHDIASYYRHYIEWGKGEGRDAVTPTSLVGYETSYNGVDYADVYDGAYYAEHHPDVREYATFRLDKAGVSLLDDGMLVQHFADWGMSEGRQASEAFSVEPYYNRYKKLRVAYGHDIASYYMHYILWGKDEGLDPVTPTSLVGYETSYNGVDYADVYDGAYYAEHHPDVREYATFRLDKAGVSLLDDGMLVQHFADWGMSEGRQASEAFSFDFYCEHYQDVRAAYGEDKAAYYMHYILWGKDEGRMGSASEEYVDSRIMGSTVSSVSQMVNRYNAVADGFDRVYPSNVYSRYGAPTIESFCKILFEEANVEGVRAEILFAQVMLETGWLQFGGDVEPDQCNFGGLGAVGAGTSGASFNDWGEDSVRKGLRAQVQHLKAYASTDPLVNTCVDPRFSYVQRGVAPTVEGLVGRWATDSEYASKIMDQVKGLMATGLSIF